MANAIELPHAIASRPAQPTANISATVAIDPPIPRSAAIPTSGRARHPAALPKPSNSPAVAISKPALDAEITVNAPSAFAWADPIPAAIAVAIRNDFSRRGSGALARSVCVFEASVRCRSGTVRANAGRSTTAKAAAAANVHFQPTVRARIGTETPAMNVAAGMAACFRPKAKARFLVATSRTMRPFESGWLSALAAPPMVSQRNSHAQCGVARAIPSSDASPKAVDSSMPFRAPSRCAA